MSIAYRVEKPSLRLISPRFSNHFFRFMQNISSPVATMINSRYRHTTHRFCIVISLCLFIHFSAAAQDSFIKGVVIDSASQKATPFLTVYLKTKTDSVVKSTITNEEGIFLFQNVVPGEYILSVSGTGYQPRIIPVHLKENTIDLGIVSIVAGSAALREVVVSASKPIIKQETDRIVYDVQADPESKVLNVLDILRKVPLIAVDAQDNILFRGNTSYRILINGRPSGLVANNPSDVLRSMPAVTIQKIEVITTPPAKYDSEGLAGIINIITNRKMADGYNGSINAIYRRPVGGPGAGYTFTLKSRKIGINAFGGFGIFNAPEQTDGGVRTTKGNAPRTLVQNNINHLDRNNKYTGIELSYSIDSLQLVTAEFNINGSIQQLNNIQNSILTDHNSNILQQYILANTGNNKWGGYGMSLNYQLGFRKIRERLLTFSYNFNRSHNGQYRQLQTLLDINYNNPNYQQDNMGYFSEHNLQADYYHPLSKKVTLEAGIKRIMRDNSSNFRYSPMNQNGDYENDPARTSEFSNDQHITSFYNSWQYNASGWSIKPGFRIERTETDAIFQTGTEKVSQHYTNIIPSVSFNKKLGKWQNINLGYTQRVQRPNISNLNPFVDRSNPDFESAGNPELQPVLSNNIELSFNTFKKGFISIGVYFSFASNTIQQVSFYDPATQITKTTFQNIGKDRLIGSNFSMNYPITPKWSFTMNGNLNFLWIDGVIDGLPVSNTGIRGNLRAGTGYNFKNGIRLNSNLNFQSPYVSLQGTTSAVTNLSFSISKSFFKNNLSVAANINNPFTKFQHFKTNSSGTDFDQRNEYRFYFRMYTINIGYRLGRLSEQIKKNKRKIVNDDNVTGGL